MSISSNMELTKFIKLLLYMPFGVMFNPETKQPDVSQVKPDILFGGGLPFSPGSNPEYGAFYDGLSHFDKEALRRFRKTYPGLTNSKAMSMFKANCCQNQTNRIRGHHF